MDGWTDLVIGTSRKYLDGYDTVHVLWGSETGIDTMNPLAIPCENPYDGRSSG